MCSLSKCCKRKFRKDFQLIWRTVSLPNEWTRLLLTKNEVDLKSHYIYSHFYLNDLFISKTAVTISGWKSPHNGHSQKDVPECSWIWAKRFKFLLDWSLFGSSGPHQGHCQHSTLPLKFSKLGTKWYDFGNQFFHIDRIY